MNDFLADINVVNLRVTLHGVSGMDMGWGEEPYLCEVYDQAGTLVISAYVSRSRQVFAWFLYGDQVGKIGHQWRVDNAFTKEQERLADIVEHALRAEWIPTPKEARWARLLGE